MSKYIYHKKSTNICEYGCNQVAHYQISKQLRWCCEKSFNGCPDVKQKKKEKYNSRTDKEKADTKKLTAETCLKKYGVEHLMQSKEFKNERKEKFQKKYGVSNPGQLDDVQAKMKKTYKAKTGYDHPSQNPDVQAKMKKTYKAKTGYDHPSQNPDVLRERTEDYRKKTGYDHPTQDPEVKEKIKEAVFKRYGVHHNSQSDEIKEKKRNTCLKNHNVEYPMQSKEILNKSQNSCLKRYGVLNPSQSSEIRFKQKKTKVKNFFANLPKRVNDRVSPLFSEEDYNICSEKYPWKCNICETKFSYHLDNGLIPRCPTCYPRTVSIPEKEIAEYVKELGFEIQCNRRDLIPPKELDIFVPSKMIAIEHHGLYWHNEEKRGRNYHFEKYNDCKLTNIRLIQVFGDEWIHKQDQVKSRLRHILGLGERKCGARQTSIREITASESKKFLIENHIQGQVGAKVKLGAFFQNELVSVMTFGALRKSMGSSAKEGTYELLRFASKYQIPGIAGKLFSWFKKNHNPKEVISYCDLRWGTGNLYEQLGFELSHISPPNYFYIIGGHREPRFKYRKDVLVKEGFDPNSTEREIMQNRGISRIYDAGNMKFIWNCEK